MTEKLWRCGRCRRIKRAGLFGSNHDPLTKVNRPVAYVCKRCITNYAKLRHERIQKGTWAGAPVRKLSAPTNRPYKSKEQP